MAIDVNTLTKNHPKGLGFAYHFSSADASGGEEIAAAPGAGKRLIVENLLLTTNVAQASSITVTIKSAADDTLGPVELDDANSPLIYPIGESGVVMGANEAINITADAGQISGYIDGRISS